MSEELGATLVEYYQHAGGWCAFVVTPNNMYQVPLFGVDDVLERMFKWLVRIERPAARNPMSYKPLRSLHQALFAPLRPYLPVGEAVVLAPFGGLHLLPLGAALDQVNGQRRYAAQDYNLAFVPGLAALRTMLDQARNKGSRPSRQMTGRVLGVAYAGVPESPYYLPTLVSEVEAIVRHFSQVTKLYGEAATPDAVLAHAREQEIIHFACHGSFDSEEPQQSGLMLAGGWLTAQRIINEMRLDGLSLLHQFSHSSSTLLVRSFPVSIAASSDLPTSPCSPLATDER